MLEDPFFIYINDILDSVVLNTPSFPNDSVVLSPVLTITFPYAMTCMLSLICVPPGLCLKLQPQVSASLSLESVLYFHLPIQLLMTLSTTDLTTNISMCIFIFTLKRDARVNRILSATNRSLGTSPASRSFKTNKDRLRMRYNSTEARVCP